MNIGILGTGNVGAALATQWAKAGHHLFLGTRNVNEFKGKHLLNNPNTSVHTIADAAAKGEVILLATPAPIVLDLIPIMGDLSDKVIIDSTNAIRSTVGPYPTAYHALVEKTKGSIVKCFNTTGFENMANPSYGNIKLDMFMAGDSKTAKGIALKLSQDAGFETCYDMGGGDKVQLLEQLAMAWINLAIFQKEGRDIGFKVLRR